jgi:hypothetical protein
LLSFPILGILTALVLWGMSKSGALTTPVGLVAAMSVATAVAQTAQPRTPTGLQPAWLEEARQLAAVVARLHAWAPEDAHFVAERGFQFLITERTGRPASAAYPKGRPANRVYWVLRRGGLSGQTIAELDGLEIGKWAVIRTDRLAAWWARSPAILRIELARDNPLHLGRSWGAM